MKNAQQIDVALSKVMSLVNQLAPDNVSPSALDLEAIYNDGIDALEKDHFKEALEIFGLLAARMPGHSSYQFGFALCLQHFGETQLAGEYYSLAFALDPSDAACAYRLGECLVACGHILEGQDALRAAIQLTALPGSAPNIRLLAEQLLESLN